MESVSTTHSEDSRVQVEIGLLERRFGETFDRKSDSVFSFCFRPTDPDFPHVFENGLLLEVELPKGYPDEVCVVTVQNEEYEVFDEVKMVISQGCKMFCKQNLGNVMIRKLLRWLDRNLEDLIDIGLEKKAKKVESTHLKQIAKEQRNFLNRRQKQELEEASGTTQQEETDGFVVVNSSKSPVEDTTSEKGDKKDVEWSDAQQRNLELALVRYPASLPPKKRWTKIAEEVPGKTRKECIDRVKELQRALAEKREQEEIIRMKHEEEASQNEEHDVGDDAEDGTVGAVQAKAVAKGTRVDLEELALENVTILKVPVLKAQVSCTRCDTVSDFTLPTRAVKQKLCSKCNAELIVRFRAEMAYSGNPTIGYIDTQDCSVHDILPTDVVAECDECSQGHLFPKYVRGIPCSTSCRECHTRIHMKIEDFSFKRLQAGIDKATLKTLKPLRRVKKKREVFRVGTPLPDEGVCKHYSKSRRWMRFPCCGKCYPCSKCHDDDSDAQNANPHIMKWATRMICGRCSKEQQFSQEPCNHCGLVFQQRSTDHWEGGSGMRNKQKMAKGDKKKYSGKAKTVSSKAKEKSEKSNKRRK